MVGSLPARIEHGSLASEAYRRDVSDVTPRRLGASRASTPREVWRGAPPPPADVRCLLTERQSERRRVTPRVSSSGLSARMLVTPRLRTGDSGGGMWTGGVLKSSNALLL